VQRCTRHAAGTRRGGARRSGRLKQGLPRALRCVGAPPAVCGHGMWAPRTRERLPPPDPQASRLPAIHRNDHPQPRCPAKARNTERAASGLAAGAGAAWLAHAASHRGGVPGVCDRVLPRSAPEPVHRAVLGAQRVASLEQVPRGAGGEDPGEGAAANRTLHDGRGHIRCGFALFHGARHAAQRPRSAASSCRA